LEVWELAVESWELGVGSWELEVGPGPSATGVETI
jgi:hypothetical protein